MHVLTHTNTYITHTIHTHRSPIPSTCLLSQTSSSADLFFFFFNTILTYLAPAETQQQPLLAIEEWTSGWGIFCPPQAWLVLVLALAGNGMHGLAALRLQRSNTWTWMFSFQQAGRCHSTIKVQWTSLSTLFGARLKMRARGCNSDAT